MEYLSRDFGHRWNVPNVSGNAKKKKNSRSVKPAWKGFPSLLMANSCYTRNGPIICHKNVEAVFFLRDDMKTYPWLLNVLEKFCLL